MLEKAPERFRSASPFYGMSKARTSEPYFGLNPGLEIFMSWVERTRRRRCSEPWSWEASCCGFHGLLEPLRGGMLCGGS